MKSRLQHRKFQDSSGEYDTGPQAAADELADYAEIDIQETKDG